MPGQDRSAVKLTYQDYCRIPEDGQRHEILDGEHFVNPAPIPYHQSVLGELHVQLHAAVQAPGLGRVFFSPIDLQLSEGDILQPDLIVILAEHGHIVTANRVKGLPDLVVEVLSPSTRRHDRIRKKARYAKAGVPEYWIVDTEKHFVEQHLLESGAYRLAERCEEVVRSAAIGGVSVDVTLLW